MAAADEDEESDAAEEQWRIIFYDSVLGFFSLVCVAFQKFPFVKVDLNVPRVLNIFQMYCIVTATPGG